MVYRNLTSQGMNAVKRKLTEEKLHRDYNCFLLVMISHGTGDNFLLDREGNKTWNIESLVTEICDVQELEGKPKLFFIEACRGRENNFTTQMSKANNPTAPCGISLPRYLSSLFRADLTTEMLASKTCLLVSPPSRASSPSPPVRAPPTCRPWRGSWRSTTTPPTWPTSTSW